MNDVTTDGWFECKGRDGVELIELHRVNFGGAFGTGQTRCGKSIYAAFIAEGRRKHEAAKCIVCEKSYATKQEGND